MASGPPGCLLGVPLSSDGGGPAPRGGEVRRGAAAQALDGEMAKPRYVTFDPVLRPGDVLPREPAAPDPPFDDPRSRFYYMARNALWAGARALGLGPGSTVLMPAYHHGIEVEVLRVLGVRFDFYPIRPDLRADPEELHRRIAAGPAAVYVTHYLGRPQPIAEIRRLCDEAGVPLIEDCALSLYGEEGGRPLGSFGDFAIFCLYKTLPVPHGGMLRWNRGGDAPPGPARRPDRLSTAAFTLHRLLDAARLGGGRLRRGAADLATRTARLLKRLGRAEVVGVDTEELDPEMLDLGVSPWVARLARAARRAEIVSRRRRNFLRLHELAGEAAPSPLAPLGEGTCPLSYPVLARDRAALRARLAEAGIETISFWSRHHPACPPGRFAQVDLWRRTVVELPVHQDLRDEDVDWMAHVLRRHRDLVLGREFWRPRSAARG
ncbi:MAG: DegT/DnrJ/EryC1/StrS aminotransferase family protein [Acidobacteria bacterium]|nr:MAG: DegT/DnrJ/EryC1/StrS aminotransferase family protein [Acidobacteriota bacterium]